MHLLRAWQRSGGADPSRTLLYDQTRLRLFLEEMEKVPPPCPVSPQLCLQRRTLNAAAVALRAGSPSRLSKPATRTWWTCRGSGRASACGRAIRSVPPLHTGLPCTRPTEQAAPRLQDEDGQTATELALQSGCSDVFCHFVAAGADPNGKVRSPTRSALRDNRA